jgi:hypothetical protein
MSADLQEAHLKYDSQTLFPNRLHTTTKNVMSDSRKCNIKESKQVWGDNSISLR